MTRVFQSPQQYLRQHEQMVLDPSFSPSEPSEIFHSLGEHHPEPTFASKRPRERWVGDSLFAFLSTFLQNHYANACVCVSWRVDDKLNAYIELRSISAHEFPMGDGRIANCQRIFQREGRKIAQSSHYTNINKSRNLRLFIQITTLMNTTHHKKLYFT